MMEQVSFFRLERRDATAIRTPAAQTVSPKPAKAVPKRGGIVGRMQSKLATALKFDQA